MQGFTRGRLTAAISISAIGIAAGAVLVFAADSPDATFRDPASTAITEARVSTFAGREPDRCVHAAEGRKLCTWRLSGRLTGPDLPEHVRPGVRLVCELPTASAEPVPGTCVAHLADARPPEGNSAAQRLPPVGGAPPDHALDAKSGAMARLARGENVSELSHLVGDAPEQCRTGGGVQTCTWPISPSSAGYELFSAMASAEGALSLTCILPLDGSTRTPGSCSIAHVPIR